MPSISRRTSNYDPASVGIGIVHIGLGAFHRAHQAAYIESCLNRHRGGDWGICAANIRSNASLVEQLNRQNGRYHLAEWTDKNKVRITEIGAIRAALFSGDDPEALLARMTEPATRIVSLSVSEKAYYLNPSTGELLVGEPNIQHDIREPGRPITAPGLLLEALRRRRAQGTAPFTVLCCDNMPDNGERTRRAVRTLAEHAAPKIAGWLDSEVAFPSTMVDRIVPAIGERELDRLADLIGGFDPCAVSTEAFSQWAIEDRFPTGRPDWELDGVEMVDEVGPYETMKLRLLNGAHSLLAYAGLARGKKTVAEAIAASELRTLIEEYFIEAGASLKLPAQVDIASYTNSLLNRFGNDALEHALSQIAADGTQKLPQRWLEGALINLEHGRSIRVTAKAVAAWLAYVQGDQVDDPMADRLLACHREHGSNRERVSALLAITEVFPEDLAAREEFREAVVDAYSNE